MNSDFLLPDTVKLSRGVYLITPDEVDTTRLLQRTAPLLNANLACLQYRNKSANAGLRREQAQALLPLCRTAGIALIINDDWQLAQSIGAAGAHLGEHDQDLASARKACGKDFILGSSCYNDMERAKSAAQAGASYLAFGAFFASSTKPLARRADIRILQQAEVFGLPIIAIGGITADNGKGLVAAGADCLAVISGIYQADDPVAAIERYRACFS